ncbi:MAG: S9 family peptidase [Acidobacteriota bacterium]
MLRANVAFTLAFVLSAAHITAADAPASLVREGIPEISDALAARVEPYLESRSVAFQGWSPVGRQMLIVTRFGNTPQLHVVKIPGGAREQLTFFDDRVGGGSFSPGDGKIIVFSRDIGGGEFYQLYRFDLSDGTTTLLTDGKSRNGGLRWSNGGERIAYSSTRRNGKDSDLYVMNPVDPKSARLVLQVKSGGWRVTDWSPDDKRLLLDEGISANEDHLHILDLASGQLTEITPKTSDRATWNDARFSADGKSIYVTTDARGEFSTLVSLEPATGRIAALSSNTKWDVEEFEPSPDGKAIAFITNENGVGKLHLIDAATHKALSVPAVPAGVLSRMRWHPSGALIAFDISSAKSPSDTWSLDVKTGRLERWTFSETGGMDPSRNVEPELVPMKSFDGTAISAFVYRPDPSKFPGKRPVIVNIHGGPEGQSRPVFLGRGNYFINEMGVAVVYPNVRGSTGYGKTYLAMDNGMHREDSVKDIGTVLDWIAADSKLDGSRVAVYGGSYGGYMSLATLTHYSERIRAGIDVVGISNFNTFLKNTQSYRQDLRRVEYGDEREPGMAQFLETISPLTSAEKIRNPLFVIAGFNDPRVPYTEGEQMIKRVRAQGTPVWYLLGKNEGHGFGKKVNADYQMLAMVSFLQRYLLD